VAYPNCPVCGKSISNLDRTIARDAAVVHEKCREEHEKNIDDETLETAKAQRIEERIAALDDPSKLMTGKRPYFVQ
jgi:hypothetical protein